MARILHCVIAFSGWMLALIIDHNDVLIESFIKVGFEHVLSLMLLLTTGAIHHA